MNILLAIDESAGLRVLKQLLSSKHHIVGILTSPASFKNTGIYKLAERSDILVQSGRLAADPKFAEWMKAKEVELLLSVHFSYIFCEKVIEAASIGSFNLHPGPLPRHAGLNPVSWAIFNGEKDYGVTLHWITRQVDGGPIAFAAAVAIEPTDNAFQLMSKCVEEGVKLVSLLVERASGGKKNIPSLPQDSKQRYYHDASVPNHGWIDWNRPAQDIFNFVRACDFGPFDSPWGFAKSRLNGQVIEFLRLSCQGLKTSQVPGSVMVKDQAVLVAASDQFLAVELVKIGNERKAPLEVLREGDLLSQAP